MSGTRGTDGHPGQSHSGADALDDRLGPGGGMALFQRVYVNRPDRNPRRALQLLSRISSAMRERAEDHSRSAVRSETDRLSAVSATVKPAK